MVRCLPACCEANRHQPVFPPLTSAFGPGLHVLSGGVGDGKTPVAVSRGGGMDGPRQVYALSGYAARDPVTVAGELHAICGRSEGMSVRGRTMARGAAAFRKEETYAVGCTDRGWIPGGDLTAAVRGLGCPGPRRGQQPAVPGMDHGVPLPRPTQGRQALQLAGAWRLAGTCGQRLHRGAADGEAASSPGTAGGSASRNPDRATPTDPRIYPSADPQPRAG